MNERKATSLSQKRFFCESEKFQVLYPFEDNCRQRFPEFELSIDNIISHFPSNVRLCSSIADLDRSRGTVFENLLLTTIDTPDGNELELTKARVCFEVLIDNISNLTAFEVTSHHLVCKTPWKSPENVKYKTTCFKTSHEHIVQLVSATCLIYDSNDRLTFDLRDMSQQYLQKIAAHIKSQKEVQEPVEEIDAGRSGCCTIL